MLALLALLVGGVVAARHPESDDALLEVDAGEHAEAYLDSEALAQSEVEADAEALAELMARVEALAKNNGENGAKAESESESEDASMMEVAAGEGEPEGSANPTYVLPYPPVLPGHYTPLFNPYTNVNPLSTPFANYAAQPGGHPSVAAAAAAHAGHLAAVNSQIVGTAGRAYPYYPYALRSPAVAALLAGNPVPFSGVAGWIHPQNLNSVGVGANDAPAEDGGAPAEEGAPAAFVEVATEETEAVGCNNCVFN